MTKELVVWLDEQEFIKVSGEHIIVRTNIEGDLVIEVRDKE